MSVDLCICELKRRTKEDTECSYQLLPNPFEEGSPPQSEVLIFLAKLCAHKHQQFSLSPFPLELGL